MLLNVKFTSRLCEISRCVICYNLHSTHILSLPFTSSGWRDIAAQLPSVRTLWEAYLWDFVGGIPLRLCGRHTSETTGRICTVRHPTKLSRSDVVQRDGHLSHIGWPIGSKPCRRWGPDFRMFQNEVQTLRNAYRGNRLTDLLYSKFYGIV